MRNEAAKPQKSHTLEQVEQTLAKTPDVRRELVERYRFLVSTGRYSVSNQDIAEAMLSDGVLENQFDGYRTS